VYHDNYARLSADTYNLKNTQDCLRKLLSAEQSGHKVELPCGYSSGLLRNSKRCEELQRQIEELSIVIKTESKRVDSLTLALKTQRDTEITFIQANKSFDYFTRVKTLDEITKSHSGVWAVKVFLFLLSFFINAMPITMQIISYYGEYERRKDHLTELRINFEKKDKI
jgi:hypothetical protein